MKTTQLLNAAANDNVNPATSEKSRAADAWYARETARLGMVSK